MGREEAKYVTVIPGKLQSNMVSVMIKQGFCPFSSYLINHPHFVGMCAYLT